MRPNATRNLWRAGWIALVLISRPVTAAELPRSPASDTPRPGVIRTPLPPEESEGLPLALVFLDLKGSSGQADGDAAARRQIEAVLGMGPGTPFSGQAAVLAIQRLRALRFVKSATYRLFDSDRPGHVVLAFTIELGTKDETDLRKGVLTGSTGDFPILYQDDRSLLRLQLNGGFGFYSDFNPWFGNAGAFTSTSPIALDPASGDSASWFEHSVEYGLAGITRIEDSPVWVYAESTIITSTSTGQDLFRSDSREMTRLEDLYGGFVIGSPDSDWSGNISAGRQNWQLNDGFLFSRFAAGANAGPYPALYLNPRTAYEMTGLAQVKWKDLRLEGFYVDPAEIDFLDSNSAYAGTNLAYTSAKGVEGSLIYYGSPESDTIFPSPSGPIPREGMKTFDARLGSANLFGIDGLELFGEHAWQTHHDVDWDASAYYLRTGYTLANAPWKPNLSYRYASFSGDNPATATYERFDAQLSSGLDTWVQGVNSKKVVSNSNLDSHRIRLNVVPRDDLSFTLDYFWLLADEAPGASDYAQELNLGMRWAISKNLYFLGVAGIGFPGDNLRERAGGGLNDWTTVQTSLFINF